MLVKGLKRLVLVIVPVLLLVSFLGVLFHEKVIVWPAPDALGSGFYHGNRNNGHYFGDGKSPDDDFDDGGGSEPFDEDIAATHHQIFSVSTADKNYFPINFGEREGLNPSIIPHPSFNDTWIIVAQLNAKREVEKSVWFAELVCDAAFKDGALECIEPPLILPIAATPGDGSKCTGDVGYFAFNVGPHDARVFFGPESPYTIYGSNSAFTCFGQWMLDFQILVDWGFQLIADHQFKWATELQRPPPYGMIEKNWFAFWDKDGQLYVHYDIAPDRVYAKMEFDGSVGPDLAPFAAAHDQNCMEKYMPAIPPEESIHQATNSLSITLCKRSDPGCEINDDNTFILTIFQRKGFYSFHSVYEPYVMLFRRTAPFEIHGISLKPIWISGRGKAGETEAPDGLDVQDSESWNQTEMLYATSVSWKEHGQKYHGYSDDVMFVSFGIEDSSTGAIDVVAESLLANLGLCSQV